MYSILILGSDGKYTYYLDDTDARWTGTKDECQAKIGALLKTYTVNKLVPVHNVTLTAAVTLADVTE